MAFRFTPPRHGHCVSGLFGSGKSTIISLICAFHKPTSGVVLVDGTDLSSVRLDSYRSQLGVVLQESFLFDGTIRDNVVFSRPDATEEQFLNACAIARVDEFAPAFLTAMTPLWASGESSFPAASASGFPLPALSWPTRASLFWMKRPLARLRIRVMIQNGLSYLMQGRTTFVIAHRLSTIRRADQILVVEGGLILERGAHPGLYALEGRYHDLYTRQHGFEANRFLAPGEGEKLFEELK